MNLPRVHTTAFNETDCIGDCYEPINNSLDNLDTAVQSLSGLTEDGAITERLLATNSVTTAKISANAVTADKINLTTSLSSIGYQVMPGGLIVQWGETGTYTTQAAPSANFPISFPTQCFNVQSTWRKNTTGSAGADDVFVQTVRISRTAVQFQIQATSVDPFNIGRISWLAIGC